ncbi:MAG: hydroxyisourate hydrolase [Pseudomonadales bacterium]|nr:hydroxyisourate hydrolase [Pseudomonadales bacterium]
MSEPVTLSTHVLDTARGRPAEGVELSLLDAQGQALATVRTDADGRAAVWPGVDALAPGRYRLRFAVGTWLAGDGVEGFYDDVEIAFRATEPGAHYHVPLLISPYGYSTYRGS